VHVVWTTLGRAPLVDASVARFLTRFLRGVARQERAQVLELGLVADHLHLLARLDVTTDIPRLMQRWKGGSAAVARQEGHSPAALPLRWNKGYALQSVSPRALPQVRAYLRAQPRHYPDRAIVGWDGAESEFDAVAGEEWRGDERTRVLARHVGPDP